MPNVTIQTAAAQLGIGQRALFRELRRLHILDGQNVPRRAYVDQGLMAIVHTSWIHPSTEAPRYRARAMITERGMAWLQRILATPAGGGANNTGSQGRAPTGTPTR